jgi:hypothetical protein
MPNSLFDEMALSDQELRPLIQGSTLVGGVYSMDYDECTIISNDTWKEQVGGIPRHCYLLATATDWDDPDEFEEEDAYAILLRVKGPTGLPHEDELMQVREEAMREMLTDSDDRSSPISGSPETIMDVMTRNEIQFSGIQAKVLGTFYQEGDDIEFGSDIDTFYSSARYKVYKPGVDALAMIASYPLDNEGDEGVRLGRVRFSETEREPIPSAANVRVDIDDFIGAKTAVFGMTRTGKSNTMKIITTAILEYSLMRKYALEDNGGVEADGSMKTDEWRIGQLLFDPAGEYANPNPQDERSISELPDDVAKVYRWGAESGSDAEPLQLNFFDEEQIQPIWNTIHQLLTRDADYVDNFKRANVVGPNNPNENQGEHIRATRRRAALYATLVKANLNPPDSFTVWITLNDDALDEINQHTSQQFTKHNGNIPLDGDNIVEFWETVAENQSEVDSAYQQASSSNSQMVDDGLEAILDMLMAKRGSGYRLLGNLKQYHNSGTSGYYAKRIYDDLSKGRIAVVDMSSGTESAIQITSERIIRYILDQAIDRFTSDKELHNIQIYLEEAHNLFNREKLKDADSTDDPYVRLAKEAAKYDIGMTYATQEVSSVDQRVLSNTANWIVTHLNNSNETKELSKFYNFEDFDRLIRKADEPGFARIKTLTGNYIIPAQIDLFDEDRLSGAVSLYDRVSEVTDGDVF